MSSRLIGTKIQHNNSYKNNDLFDGEEYELEDNDEDIFNIDNNNDIFSRTEVCFVNNTKKSKEINKNE